MSTSANVFRIVLVLVVALATKLTFAGLNIPLPDLTKLQRTPPRAPRQPNPPPTPNQPPTPNPPPTPNQPPNVQPESNQSPAVNTPPAPNRPPTPYPQHPRVQPGRIASYTSPDGRLRFNYPAGWTPSVRGNVISIYRNPRNVSEGLIEVLLRREATPQTADQFYVRLTRALSQTMPDLRVTLKQRLNANAIVIGADYSANGLRFQLFGIVFVKGGQNVFAYYAAQSHLFRRAEALQSLTPVVKSL